MAGRVRSRGCESREEEKGVLWVLPAGSQGADSSGSWEEREAQGAGLLWDVALGVLGAHGGWEHSGQSVCSCTPRRYLVFDLFSVGIRPGFLLKKGL